MRHILGRLGPVQLGDVADIGDIRSPGRLIRKRVSARERRTVTVSASHSLRPGIGFNSILVSAHGTHRRADRRISTLTTSPTVAKKTIMAEPP